MSFNVMYDGDYEIKDQQKTSTNNHWYLLYFNKYRTVIGESSSITTNLKFSSLQKKQPYQTKNS